MADATDSKSVARKGVWVQVPPPAVSASVGAADVGVSDNSPQKADDCCAISKGRKHDPQDNAERRASVAKQQFPGNPDNGESLRDAASTTRKPGWEPVRHTFQLHPDIGC